MRQKTPRLAVRAVIVHDGKLLLVNAWPDGKSKLLCAPGGGVEPGSALPDNLVREVYEETGLHISVGTPCLVNEFHDPDSGFHQVEVFFRCRLVGKSDIDPAWQDPERIVSEHHWVSARDYSGLMVKPAGLREVAFGGDAGITYDPLEVIVW
jgi:8-oxo-dGTP pyrophosphatase MutT (NUDIX family)